MSKGKATIVIAEIGARSPWSGVEEIIYRCGNCNARLHLPNEDYPAASYCPNCGVLLDSSGEDESGWKEWTGKDDYLERLKTLKLKQDLVSQIEETHRSVKESHRLKLAFEQFERDFVSEFMKELNSKVGE